MRRAHEIESHDDAGHPLAAPPAFDVIVVGASLGGRAVLERMLEKLPAEFPVPIVVVQHMRALSVSHLPELLAACTRLAVRHAFDDELLCPSTVYVAMPNRHLEIAADRRCRLTSDSPYRFSRPAINTLFRSAAAAFGARTLGVVLTGLLDDGAAGATEIRRGGGLVLAQEPATCQAPSMPRAALACGGAQLALPPDALGAALVALVTTPGTRAMFGLNGWPAA